MLAAELDPCADDATVQGFLEDCHLDTPHARGLAGALCTTPPLATGSPCAMTVECAHASGDVCRPSATGTADLRCLPRGRSRLTVAAGACGDACDGTFDCGSGLGCAGGMCIPDGVGAADVASCSAQDRTSATTYLASRSSYWRSRRPCALSCHTTVPFLVSSSALDADGADIAGTLLSDTEERAMSWDSIAPWYGTMYGASKPRESFGTEAVLDAFVVLRHERATGERTDLGRTVLANLWAEQTESGDWDWLQFNLVPWESRDGRSMGVAYAALGLAAVSDDYLVAPPESDAAHVAALRDRLRALAGESVHNQLLLLWASSEWPDLLSAEERDGIAAGAIAMQHPDGGWNLAEIGDWRAQPAYPAGESTAYATALAALALATAGPPSSDPALRRATEWLAQNVGPDGEWQDTSLNADDAFNHGLVTDAATAYAVMALDAVR